ncbi:major capsid protein [Microviridae sp.]|nr:major capsid protein [Microviridae sp.]
MKSVMAHDFAQVPKADIPRSVFNRTHGYKSTMDSGYLVPFYVDEALPGDTFNLNATLFARLATPIVPVMDNMHLDTHYFAVPIRLVWENWQKMQGERLKPEDSNDFLVPQIEAPEGGFTVQGIEDYFGLPTGVDNISVSALWHRAYNLIFNEWYRDENLQDPVPVNTDDGPDDPADYVLKRRGKRFDYFTSCLPWPQKGPGVEIPLGDKAYIKADIPFDGGTGVTNRLSIKDDAGTDQMMATSSGTASTLYGANIESTIPETAMYADLSEATAATINTLRQAFQLQKLFERDARGGTRYIELLKSRFNVTNPDFRLQRPEYLGGGSQTIMVNPVSQTSASDGNTPQGNQAAFGVSGGSSGFTKSFTEHTIIIAICSIRADLTYQSGIPRMFSRRTRFDYYEPALAHLGEQSVLNKEIYAQGTDDDEKVFGYNERWSEYRYYPSKITGKFRSSDPQSLDIWHLSQDFGSLPTLNSQFIEENPPVERIVAVTDEPEFIFDSYIQSRTARPIPTYSVPGLIDHF